MSDTYTTRNNLTKPENGASSDTWGTKWNDNADDIDNQISGPIYGLTLSAAGGTATYGISAGGVQGMNLASAFTKTLASWSLGSGGGSLDTGTTLGATNTWYHIFIIQRSDTGVCDILASLDPASPTMPSNYDRKRRIGSMKTDGSKQWIKFTQNGDEFLWDARVTDANASPANTNAITITLASIPTGVKVDALMTGLLIYGSTSTVGIISPLDVSDQDPAVTYDLSVTSTINIMMAQFVTRTNTSAQIRARFSATGATYVLVAKGWIDTRGRNG